MKVQPNLKLTLVLYCIVLYCITIIIVCQYFFSARIKTLYEVTASVINVGVTLPVLGEVMRNGDSLKTVLLALYVCPNLVILFETLCWLDEKL